MRPSTGCVPPHTSRHTRLSTLVLPGCRFPRSAIVVPPNEVTWRCRRSGLVGREQAVDLAACLVEQLGGACTLRIPPCGGPLVDRHQQMMDGMAKVGSALTRVGGSLVPWCCLGGGELLGGLA